MKGRLFGQICTKAWDGDDFGNEWRCGFTAHPSKNDNAPESFDIYEDDGKGNGNFVCTAPTRDIAVKVINALCAHLDSGGMLNTFHFAAHGADPCDVEPCTPTPRTDIR